MSRPLAAPTVVVLMGVAGAGKTTVGRALAATLGCAFHDADDHHAASSIARMRAGHALTDAERDPWLAALRLLVAGVLSRGEVAVLACSALRRSYRDALVPADAPDGAVRFVHLVVPPAVVAARLAARTGHFAPPALLDSQLATLEPPTLDEDATAVDASRPVQIVVTEIVARLVRVSS